MYLHACSVHSSLLFPLCGLLFRAQNFACHFPWDYRSLLPLPLCLEEGTLWSTCWTSSFSLLCSTFLPGFPPAWEGRSLPAACLPAAACLLHLLYRQERDLRLPLRMAHCCLHPLPILPVAALVFAVLPATWRCWRVEFPACSAMPCPLSCPYHPYSLHLVCVRRVWLGDGAVTLLRCGPFGNNLAAPAAVFA